MIIDGGAHFLSLTDADAVNPHLQAFLSSVDEDWDSSDRRYAGDDEPGTRAEPLEVTPGAFPAVQLVTLAAAHASLELPIAAKGRDR